MPREKIQERLGSSKVFLGNLSHIACFSEQIRNVFGKRLKVRRNRRVKQILDEFWSLNRLENVYRDPINFQKKLGTIFQPQEFATFLGKIFQSDLRRNTPTLRRLGASADVRGFQDILCFQIEKFQGAQMFSRKTGAVDGVVVAMFKYGSAALHSCL